MIAVVVVLGFVAVALAYFFGQSELFQGYFRYDSFNTAPTTLERLSTGQRIDSADDDAAGLGVAGLERDEDSTVRRYGPLD